MYETNMGGITPLKMQTQPIIPLVYGDALSYMEMVAKMTQKVNEVIGKVNNIQVDVFNESKEYTDEQIRKGLVGIGEAVKEVELLKHELENQYTEFSKFTNAQLTLFNGRIDDTNKRVDDAITALGERTDLAIDQNNSYLLGVMSSFLSQIKVVNFFTGNSVSVQDMLDYLSMLHVDNSMNYDYLVDLRMDYNTLSGIDMTFTQMVLFGKDLIG